MVFNYEKRMLKVLSQVQIKYFMTMLCDAKFTSLGHKLIRNSQIYFIFDLPCFTILS